MTCAAREIHLKPITRPGGRGCLQANSGLVITTSVTSRHTPVIFDMAAYLFWFVN